MMLLNKISGKKILITGGAGFIGSYLVEKLVEENQLTIFDNLRRNALKYTNLSNHKNLHLVVGDILDKKNLEKTVKENEIVIHLAAIAGVSSYYKNPLQTLEVDALGTYYVLQLSSKYNVQQVLLFSTSEVYGPNARNVSEDSLTVQGPATDSRWSYSVGKLIGDHFAFAFSKMEKLPITVVRPFNIYGPRQVGEGAIQIFIKQSLQNLPVSIRGDGSQIRAWCYISDFIGALYRIIGNEKAYNQIFNIGDPQSFCTTKELAKLILLLTKSKSKLQFTESTITDVIERIPAIDKATKLLGFEPKINLKNGLMKTLSWFSEYEKK